MKTKIHKTTAGGSVVSRFDYGYDAQRRIHTWTKTQGGSASQLSMGYNAIGELTGVRQTQISSGELTDRWFFDYDAASNRTSNQHGNVVQTAQHNNLNQLTATVGGGKTRFVGQLNEAGKAWVSGAEVPLQSDNSFETNLDLAPGTHTVSVEAEDGSGNHASKQYQIDVQAGASATFTHDTNGNLLSDGNRTYTWDPRNRLKSATVNGVVYSWDYDGLDRRITEKVNGTLTKRWVWDGLAIVQQLNASGALAKDYYDEGFKDGATAYYYTRDHLGSIREVTSSTGTVVATYDYSPWGQRTQLTGTVTADHGFTGHLTHEETGLVMAPYRAYEADLGRWLRKIPTV